MIIPSEAIGSIPRPIYLLEAIAALRLGRLTQPEFDKVVERAVIETVQELEATGSTIVSDGEQAKPSFATYPLVGLTNIAADGVVIPFADGHARQLPRLTAGPFRYARNAGRYVAEAKQHTALPIKQAVIAPSALSLLYPEAGIDGYSRARFIEDLTDECEKDIRSALQAGAAVVQLDFTEGRLACKLDPSRALLKQFVSLNNAVLDRFSEADRTRIGIHTCPGGDHNTTHSADVDYAELLPDLFEIKAGRFYIQMASEPDRSRVLDIVQRERKANQITFIGVVDPCDPLVESPETVRDRALEAAEYLKGERFGTTDDCGFAPFRDDVAMARVSAFAKIRSRLRGTALAAEALCKEMVAV